VVRGIAADLATKLVTQDELDRASKPLQEQVMRASSGNQFWMLELKGASLDDRRVTVLRRYLRDIAATTPEDIKALAIKYLKPEAGFGIVVLPEKSAPAAVTAAPTTPAAKPAS
jgi:zinc protease